MWYNPVMEWLLKSPLHRMIDGSTMIVYYTGRKTGKAYHIPAGYLQADDTLITISFKQRSWWRNLRGGANVTILLRGMLVSAHAVVHEDEQGVVEGLKEFIGAKPQAARMVGVDLDLDGQPIPDSLQQAALKKKESSSALLSNE